MYGKLPDDFYNKEKEFMGAINISQENLVSSESTKYK